LKLINNSQNKIVANELSEAKSFAARSVGLLGRKKMHESEALWIKPCNAIHTWFMQFAIDCVFVDKNLKVVKIHRDVKPWKLRGPILKAHSVIEFTANATTGKISEGDQLHVDA
jgi:uncharacterized protein